MTTNTTARRSSAHTREAILAALAATPEPITVIELAEIAGLGKSTLAKHLPALEKEGLAVRTPGGRDGRRRLPDEWALAATAQDINTATVADAGEAGSPSERVSHPLPAKTSTDAADNAGAGAQDAATEVSGDSAPETFIPGFGTVSEAALDAVSGKATGARVQEPSVPVAPVREAPKAPARPKAGTARIGSRAGAEANPVSGSTRLAPGELKLMVRAILDADPGEEFAATAISHILQGRSIGAIQNNLARLAKEGHAVQTSDRPRRYQSAKQAR